MSSKSNNISFFMKFTIVIIILFWQLTLSFAQITYLNQNNKIFLSLNHILVKGLSSNDSLEIVSILQKAAYEGLDSLQTNYDYIFFNGHKSKKEQLPNINLTLSISFKYEVDLDGEGREKIYFIDFDIKDNVQGKSILGINHSNPNKDFIGNNYSEIKSFLIKTFKIIFHLRIPPHSYLAMPVNTTSKIKSISINQYFDCKGCQDKKTQGILTDLVNNMIVYKQMVAENNEKWEKFNYYPNYLQENKEISDIEIKGKINIMPNQNIILKLSFENKNQGITLVLPDVLEFEFDKNIIERNDFTQFITKVNSTITSFYVRNFKM